MNINLIENENNLLIYKNNNGNIVVDAIYKMKLYGYHKKECQRFLNVQQIILAFI